MKALMTFSAGVLSVIAAGVVVIAFSLLYPRTSTADATLSRPMYAGDRVMIGDDASRYYGMERPITYPSYAAYGAVPVSDVRAVPAVETYAPPRRVTTVARPVSYQERSAPVVRSSGRDWKKTAMIIGGSSGAAAGVGAI